MEKQRISRKKASDMSTVPPFTPLLFPLPPQDLDVSLAAAAADTRLLFQPGTKTRGTQRTIGAQRGTEKHEQDNKCTARPTVSRRKLRHKQKRWFPVHVCSVSVSPSAAPLIRVQ